MARSAKVYAQAKPLREVVGHSLTISELAILSGVSKSTLSRLWDSETWVDRRHYATIARLGVVVPGVAEYVRWAMNAERLEEAASNAQRSGIVLDLAELERAGHKISPVRLALVLDAVGALARGESQQAFRRLDICWGSQTDTGVSLVFESGLVKNRRELQNIAASAVVEGVRRDGERPQIGRGIIVHKLVKCGFEVPVRPLPPENTRAKLFDSRSRLIARAMATSDYGSIDSYESDIQSSRSVRSSEIWSLATYSANIEFDDRPRTVPRNVVMRRTADDLIADLAKVDGAYAYYLTHVAIPTILTYDPAFGGRRAELHKELEVAVSRSEENNDPKNLSAACALLAATRPRG